MCVCMITSCSPPSASDSPWIPQWCHMDPGPNLSSSSSSFFLSLVVLIKCIKMFILSSLVVIRYFLSSQCHQLKAEPCLWEYCTSRNSPPVLHPHSYCIDCSSKCHQQKMALHPNFCKVREAGPHAFRTGQLTFGLAVDLFEECLDLTSPVQRWELTAQYFHTDYWTPCQIKQLLGHDKQWLCSKLHTSVRVLHFSPVYLQYSVVL